MRVTTEVAAAADEGRDWVGVSKSVRRPREVVRERGAGATGARPDVAVVSGCRGDEGTGQEGERRSRCAVLAKILKPSKIRGSLVTPAG